MFQDSALSADGQRPLADRMRPKSFTDIVGHKSIIGEHSILFKSMQNGKLFSFILWGAPGVGKTTIARLIAGELNVHFISLSAVTAGVKELREAIATAERNRNTYNSGTIVFIDEIHRFNKSQQDALLHAVESGLLTLIGATTENPSFEVNPALLSRMKVFKLEPLPEEDLRKLVLRALEQDDQLNLVELEQDVLDDLIMYAGGDGRKCLSVLETAVILTDEVQNKIKPNRDILQQAALSLKSAYDKKSDYHYDTISAFIKSIRGSDPDAALLWLARMLDGGEDPMFIARRLIISASEDIGNSDPTALILAVNAMEAVRMIGMPEARIILAQVVTYLASTTKSNASYVAIDAALADIKNTPTLTVPLHLRNGVTKLMKNEGYGAGYQYPHDFPQHFTPQHYFPVEIGEKSYYSPTKLGREKNFFERLQAMWQRLKSD
jgi:putative ATPase